MPVGSILEQNSGTYTINYITYNYVSYIHPENSYRSYTYGPSNLWSFVPNGVRVVRFRVLLGTDDNYSLLSTDCGSSPASLWATLSVTLKVDGIVYFTKLVGKFTDPTAIPVDIDVSTNSSIVFTVVQAGSSNNCNHMMFANIRFDYCPVGMYGQYC